MQNWTDHFWRNNWRARPHPLFGLCLDLLLQVLQLMEDTLLSYCHNIMWNSHRILLGLCLRLYRFQAHLAYGSMHESLRDQFVHVQEVLQQHYWSLYRTMLPIVRYDLQPVQEIEPLAKSIHEFNNLNTHINHIIGILLSIIRIV